MASRIALHEDTQLSQSNGIIEELMGTHLGVRIYRGANFRDTRNDAANNSSTLRRMHEVISAWLPNASTGYRGQVHPI